MKKAEKKEIFEKWNSYGFLENDLGEKFNIKLALIFEHIALILIADSKKEIRRYSETLDTVVFSVLYQLAVKYNMKIGKREANRVMKELNSYITSNRVITLIHQLSTNTNIHIEAELLAEFAENYSKK